MERKTLLLIGPGKYFGAELVHAFSSAGYAIGIITGSVENLEQFKDAIDIGEIADITNNTEYKSALKKVCGTLGHISCLIYNPKMSVKGTGLDIDIEDFQKSLQVNAVGAVVAIQEALPFLENGKVILTNGGFKDVPDPDRFALSVGKSTLFGIQKALEAPLKKKNISLHTITIDGFVREDAAITPKLVSEAFLKVAEGSFSESELVLEG